MSVLRRALRFAVFLSVSAAMSGCGGSSSVGSPSPTSTKPRVAQGSQAQNACTLVTTGELVSLGVTGAGNPSKVSVGTATTYGCTWGHPPSREFHLQFEQLDAAAATQVKESLGGHGTVVPGIGDGARGQFGSVLAAVNFYRGDTFVNMALFGPGTGSRKPAFLTVAKDVAAKL